LSLFNELKRRNVFRIGAAYVVGAWLLIQVTETIFPLFGFGDTPARLVVIVLAIGFIPSLILSWVFEFTPEGLKKDADVDSEKSITQTTGRKLDRIILVVLALALGYFAFDKFVLDPVEDEQIAQSARQEGLTAALTESFGDRSIAVLPFDNRSNREEDQFFTDGIHDDLLTTIAKIGSMTVISRTSVMEYRDTIKKIPQIAKELGVANILEGGIQRSGDHVRINVQLIDAATDKHLWAETYNRELTAENLFAVQSEITRIIADALQAELSTDEQRRLNARPTDNLQAYEAYMRGRQLMATRNSANLKLATEEFSKATRLDPLFALAWVGVADSNMIAHSGEDLLPIVEEAVKNALAIDNELGEAYASLASIHSYYNRHGEAEAAYQKAIELSPNYATAYYWYSSFLGKYPLRLQEQVELARKAAELDPRSSSMSLNLGQKYLNQGLYTLAEGQYQKVIELSPDFAPGYSNLAVLYMLYMGQFDKALPPANKAVELDPGNQRYNSILVFLYLQLSDLEAAQMVRERMASLGAAEWRLGFTDVLINFNKSITTRNPADTLESINKLLPKIRNFRFYKGIVAFIAAALGDNQLSREIYLSADPGWLEPDQWPELVERHRSNACLVAWVLINTGDEKLGSALLRQAISYFDDSLPLLIEHSDMHNPDACYVMAGDIEKTLLSIETQLSHNHLYAWRAAALLPVYDLIRDEPRWLAAQAEYERRISVQRENIKKMATDQVPSGQTQP
jgi:TolB-like protein/Tfp pilus assembly protein PilF